VDDAAQRAWTTDDWCSPPEVVGALDAMGGVALDPCSNDWSIVGAKRTYDIHRGEDGLVLPWDEFGLNYINPPYSNPRPWMARAAGEVVENILLVNYDATEAWKLYGWPSDALCFIDHRVKFIGPKKFSSRAPNTAIYWGWRIDLFEAAWTRLGKVLVRP
jgi:hypothetical protein